MPYYYDPHRQYSYREPYYPLNYYNYSPYTNIYRSQISTIDQNLINYGYMNNVYQNAYNYNWM